MLIRLCFVFVALVVLVALTASAACAGCKFQPCEQAQRIIDDKDRYREMREFADTTRSDRQAAVFTSNEKTYLFTGNVDSTIDKVVLKLLTSPSGQVLDAKVIDKGKQKQSKCLALRWASENQLISPIIGSQSMSCWTLVDVTINYEAGQARVGVLPPTRRASDYNPTGVNTPAPGRRVIADTKGKDSDLPGASEFVAVETIAEMIHQVQPEYPRSEKEAGHEGVVWVKALVGKDGSVLDAIVYKSSGYPLLDNAALDVALENKFKPATKDGEPTAMWVTYKVNFATQD